MFSATFGVLWYKNYDERTYCIPVMRGKIQRNKQRRSLMMMRGPIVFQLCVGRYRETNKEDP